MKKCSLLLRSVSTKVVLVMILLVLPLNVIAIVQNNKAIGIVVEQGRAAAQNLIDVQLKDLEKRMENHQFLLSYLLTKDGDCIRMRSQPSDDYLYDSAKYRLYGTMSNLANMISGGEGYYFYMKEKKDMLAYHNPMAAGHPASEIADFIEEHCEDPEYRGWHIINFSSGSYYVLILDLNEISYGGWISLDPITESMESALGYDEYEVCFSDTRQSRGKDWVCADSCSKDLWLTVCLNRQELIGKMSDYQKASRYLSFLYLLLIPVLYFALYKLLIQPLRRLGRAHAQIQNGNRFYRLTQNGGSVEFNETYASFNQRCDVLDALRVESYEKEIEIQKMELKNLQLQIRPHFLQNTFNLIFTLTQKGAGSEIGDIVLYLSEYFRHIFRSEKELEIFSKEQKLIEGYIRVASIRYDGMISAEYSYDPEISYVRVPPLLVHNFIENSVKYGVKPDQVLHISVEGYYEEGAVTFIISDDGNGMAEDVLKRSQSIAAGEYICEDDYSHVGLQNSIKRLKYFYGASASIQIDSAKGEGTCIAVSFPYDLEVDDEPADGK